jgi:hypothetical protein
VSSRVNTARRNEVANAWPNSRQCDRLAVLHGLATVNSHCSRNPPAMLRAFKSVRANELIWTRSDARAWTSDNLVALLPLKPGMRIEEKLEKTSRPRVEVHKQTALSRSTRARCVQRRCAPKMMSSRLAVAFLRRLPLGSAGARQHFVQHPWRADRSHAPRRDRELLDIAARCSCYRLFLT